MSRIRKPDFWSLNTWIVILLYSAFLIYPIGNLLKLAVTDPSTGAITFEYFERFFAQSYYSSTITNSLTVASLGTIFALIVGTVMAYFFTFFKVRGDKYLRILIILCMMSAPFIGAYSWILLLGRNGAITNLFASIGIQTPEIYGVFGIVLVFTTQLFPLVFMMVGSSMRKIDMSLIEAANNMGVSGFKLFYKIILPLIVPTLLSSGLLVFMQALADFGTPMLLGEGYRVVPVLIYNEFVGEVTQNSSFASAISVVVILFTTVIFLIQKFIANRMVIKMTSLRPVEKRQLSKGRDSLMHLLIYTVTGVSLLPQANIIYTSFKNTAGKIFVEGYSLDNYRKAFDTLGNSIWNTIRIPLIALIVCIVLGVVISYLVDRRRNVATGAVDVMSMIPYIIPGTVMGIAFLSAFNNGIFNSGFLAIGGTVGIMVVSFVVRRLPYSIRSSTNAIQQIHPSTEEAATSLGSSKINTFLKITVPMMVPGIMAGAILSWITMISELSTSVLLYTARTQTLTVSIYTQVLRGNYGTAGALATILTAFTIISLLVLTRFTNSEDVTL